MNTFSLHSLIDFDHREQFEVLEYPEYFKYSSRKRSRVFKVSLDQTENLFLSVHVIDGQILFPATAILTQVWLIVAKFILPRQDVLRLQNHQSQRQGHRAYYDVKVTLLAYKHLYRIEEFY